MQKMIEHLLEFKTFNSDQAVKINSDSVLWSN